MFWCEIGIKWILDFLDFAYTLGLKAYGIRAGYVKYVDRILGFED